MEGSGPATLPSAEELGSGFARMPLEGSGARGSRYDAWASYVPPPLSIDHFMESKVKAKVLNEALENCEGHVATLANAVVAAGGYKDSVVYVSVVVSVDTLQCQ